MHTDGHGLTRTKNLNYPCTSVCIRGVDPWPASGEKVRQDQVAHGCGGNLRRQVAFF